MAINSREHKPSIFPNHLAKRMLNIQFGGNN